MKQAVIDLKNYIIDISTGLLVIFGFVLAFILGIFLCVYEEL